MLKPLSTRALGASLQRVPASRPQCHTICNSGALNLFLNGQISSPSSLSSRTKRFRHDSTISTIATSNNSVDEIQKPSIPGILIKTLPEHEKSSKYIQAFNRAVVQASRALYDDRSRENLWQSYQTAKRNVSSFIHLVPNSAWNRLWKTQSSCRPQDMDRLGNLVILVQDMSIAGLDTRKQQEVLRLEQVFASGRQEEALSSWFEQKSDNTTFPTSTPLHQSLSLRQWEKELARKGFDKEWLELGIRLYAAAGKTPQSHKILADLAKRFRNTDPRFVVYIILFFTSTGKTINIERAWASFLDLLTHDKFKLSTHDFELILKSFLGAGSLEYATIVACRAIATHGKSIEHYSLLYEEFVHQILANCTSQEQVHATAVTLMEFIPSNLPNPHHPSKDKSAQDIKVMGPVSSPAQMFFTTWIERAKIFGDPYQIAYIIEVMYEQGSDVLTRNLDILLELWFEGSAEQKLKAEKLAQQMIEKKTHIHQEESLADYSVTRPWFPRFLRRKLPPAGQRTYIKLLKFYAEENDLQSVQHIVKILAFDSGLTLTGNTVRAVLSIHFTMGDIHGAWTLFNHVVDSKLIELDFATYSVMWKGLHKHLSTGIRLNRGEDLSPRELFRHMMYYLGLRADVPDSASDTLYERIIKCFCLSNDTIGLWIALQGMNDIFEVEPTIKTIQSVVKHIAIQDSRADHFENSPEKNWIEHLTTSLRMLESSFLGLNNGADNASKDLSIQPIQNLYQLDSNSSGGDILQLLSIYVKKAANMVHPQAEDLRVGINVAKDEMGFSQWKRITRNNDDYQMM
jgi:hypothetical protein